MARSEIWIIDDANPTGHWVWIGGYDGPGVTPPEFATAAGFSTTIGVAIAGVPGVVSATADGLSTTTGVAVAATGGAQYLSLPGVSGSIASVPSAAELQLSGANTLRVRMRKSDWTPVTDQVVLSRQGATGNWSWVWRWQSESVPYFQRSTTGSNSGANLPPTSPSPALVDGTTYWLEMKVLQDFTVSLSTHPDQPTEPTSGWTLAATSSPLGSMGAIFPGTADMVIGSIVGGSFLPLAADIFQMALYDETDTKVFQLDPANWSGGSTWVTSTGHTVTLAGSALINSE